MTKGELQGKLIEYKTGLITLTDCLTAVEAYSSASNNGKPLVMRSLPPASEIEQALNLAQAEIRAMYKRLDIKGSNVLDKIDATLEAVQAAMPS